MPEESRLIESWKEIASYLKKSEKTCRRWENELGLPVHRLEDSPKARVFAHKEEIDRWMENVLGPGYRIKGKRGPVSPIFIFKGLKTGINLKKTLSLLGIFILLLILAVVSFQTIARRGKVPITSAKHSIAVLPFVDLSPEKDKDYLADGMAESIINALSSIPDLKVSARTSAFSFKGKDKDIKEVGKTLGVDAVLEGSVQVGGNILRVTARVSDVEDGYQLWSRRYECSLQDIFIVQDEIAEAVVNAVKGSLLSEEKGRLKKKYTQDLEAYNFFLQGRYFWNKRSREDLHKSIEFFEKALEKDPNFVPAYVGLADSYRILGNNGMIPPEAAFPIARELALKALALDSRIAEAHTSLAAIKRDYDWDWSGSEKEYRLALQLNPDYSLAHHSYALLLSDLGRHDKAIREIRAARDLDPLDPRLAANVGLIFHRADKHEQALEELRKAKDLYPEHGAIYEYEAIVYTDLGRFEEAMASLQRCADITREEPTSSLAFVYARFGKMKEAEVLIQRMIEESEKTYVPLSEFACIYGALGDLDRAISLLEKAYLKREKLRTIKCDPWFDPLRADPRFKALIKKMKLD